MNEFTLEFMTRNFVWESNDLFKLLCVTSSF